MKLIAVTALVVLLVSCKDQPVKPTAVMDRLEGGDLSDDDLKIVTNEFPGMTQSCISKIRAAGINAMPKRTEDCFEMTPPRRWTGLWRADLEGSLFCADAAGKPARECQNKDGGFGTWFEPGREYTADGALYRVEFIGRRTARPGKFGTYGFYQHEMVVDRMISMKEVEPPAPAPTKAEMIKHWKGCEAAGNCIPNWEEINKIED